jgi:dihydroneopterin aldolase
MPDSETSRPVALVTGGSRRIGLAIGLELAAAGWDLALHHRRSGPDVQQAVQALRAAGARVQALQADLADEAAADALVPRAVAALGRLDAVVNNASTFEHDDLASFGHAAMALHWHANTAAPLLLARGLHAHLRERGGSGCVVHLLDQKLWNPNPDHLSYTLSKAALQASVPLLAQALAPQVRVCAVAPGITLPSGPMSDEEFERARRMTPLQHSSTPQDVARAVRFLLEAPAVTGTTLLVDGGQHLWPQPRDVLYLARDEAPTLPAAAAAPGGAVQRTSAATPVPRLKEEPQTLAHCRRLFLRNHEVRLLIGIHDFERAAPQRLLINVDLYVPLASSTPARDAIDEVVDYDFIRLAIAERVARGPVQLQETLCDELLARMLAHPGVVAARVSTQKPDVYSDCEGVGVEVFGFRSPPSP